GFRALSSAEAPEVIGDCARLFSKTLLLSRSLRCKFILRIGCQGFNLVHRFVLHCAGFVFGCSRNIASCGLSLTLEAISLVACGLFRVAIGPCRAAWGRWIG